MVQVKVKKPTGSNLMLELNKSWNGVLLVRDCLLKSEDSGTVPIC